MFGWCLAQSRNCLGAIISHSPLLLNTSSSTPALEVVLVLCSALRATSSVSPGISGMICTSTTCMLVTTPENIDVYHGRLFLI
ncbi:hypothetical protein HETIRDRAFT_423372 [Heterobasidion irregulare TC 32-1]|uniref:Uncharacterized protein n=1 Tax=Heterobasidion irregulare (strain TC 32-1) TaxID=747525 RepID=W4JMK2_HETIT|nr:uncharacterized protein HETIRDRAFT_423372 [Heterobasidion irregulare TC 32-1]ETW74704.1 hypothetical protein HETIRDRAFT_423372 [Heterobasidion irregulare TC 32-1]